MSAIREFSSDNVKQSIHKNVVEEKELKTTLARIDGQRHERMFEIQRSKDKFVRRHSKHSPELFRRRTSEAFISPDLSPRGSLERLDVSSSPRAHRFHKSTCSSPVRDEVYSDTTKTTKRLDTQKWNAPQQRISININFNNSQIKSKGNLYRSKTEALIKPNHRGDLWRGDQFDSHAIAVNHSVTTESTNESRGDEVDGEYTEIDDETETYKSTPLASVSRSRSDGALKHLPTSVKSSSSFTSVERIRHRVKSEEKLDYLLRNVFERLNAGFTRKRPNAKAEVSKPSGFASLRTCRYLRLPLVRNTQRERDIKLKNM